MNGRSNILITGGCGFIGSNFIRAALAQKSLPLAKLVNLDALTYAGRLDNLTGVEDPRYVFVHGEIGDSTLMSKILREHRIDTVLNFAAESHVDRSIDRVSPFVQTNVVGVVNLLETCLGYFQELPEPERHVFRVVQISTDEVYGSLDANAAAFTESSGYAPSNPYAASKAAADHFAWSFYKTHGLPLMVSHCSNNYGPRQLPEKLIPLMILNSRAGLPLPVYGKGTNIRDWIYVDDYAAGLLALMAKGRLGQGYHFGGGQELSNLSVVQKICDFLDADSPLASGRPRRELIQLVSDRPGHDFRYAMNTQKAKQELGWSPQVGFDEGIKTTIRWYLDHADWVAGAVRYDRKVRID